MNTYNENLQATVSTTLAVLTQEQARLQSVKIANEYSLYYAQEAQIGQQDSVQGMIEVQSLCSTINDQSVLNENAVGNLSISATTARDYVAASNTNMATAASNVNIAANAIVALAAGIGSALNNAIASEFKSEIHKQVLHANNFINETANDAKELSLLAMDASSRTSEIVMPALLLQTTEVKARIDGLLKTTQAALDSVTAQVKTGAGAVKQAVQQELKAESAVSDIVNQVEASAEAYKRTNTQLNLGLVIEVKNSHEIDVSFNGPPVLIPQFSARPANQILIPDAETVYYLALLPQSQSATFAIDQAQQLFAYKSEGQFIAVKASGKVQLTKDVYGDAVAPGAAYVAYLYMEFSMGYRRYIGDFSDALSSPSQPFTLATTLAQAKPSGTPTVTSTNNVLTTTLYFSAAFSKSASPALEFHCILVEDDSAQALGLLTSRENKELPIYFNLNIAQQVAPSNYTIAQQVSSTKTAKAGKNKTAPAVEESALEESSALESRDRHYTVSITKTTTDNFGNPLKPNTSYKPFILTLLAKDQENSNAYINVLSDALHAMTFPDFSNPSVA